VDALLIVIITFVGYLIAYNTYGRFLARRIFRLNDQAIAPSRELEDGIDYVPTRKGIIFGHHYTSIAGTGPIVGPAIGIIWGWVPALIWVFVGSIVMGAVHDFGALVMSLRNQGKSMAEIADRYIGKQAKTMFFLIVLLGLLIVIAIFGMVIASIFAIYPGSIFPVWCQIPIAVLLGIAVYKWKRNVVASTAVAVLAMYITVVVGSRLPLKMPAEVLGMPATGVWTIILLIYAYVASAMPVTVLLQPRDYINAWQLFIAMGLLVGGIVAATATTGLHLAAPAFNPSPAGAPPIWPFLFVTIACGAISGFHCLVASGTTSKQLRKEGDALFVGYGSMLLEGALAILVIVAVAAGIGMLYETTIDGQPVQLTGAAAWNQHYQSWGAAKGLGSKMSAVVAGSANMLAALGIPAHIGMVIMGVFIASFAGTTLDTATRIQRYVIAELATDLKLPALSNRWIATAAAVVSAGALAFATGADGRGALTLWPMFGAVNQLLAAMALLIATVYLKRKTSWGYYLTLVPCLFMLVMTIWAMIANQLTFMTPKADGGRTWVLIVVNALILLAAIAMIVVTLRVFFKPRAPESRAGAA